ncbi:MAG: TIGR03086 family metal-binding protein [Acidimicrobiales bacterium]
MDEVALLQSVLDKTGDLIAGVREDQWGRSTPCPAYDVRQLTDHLVGWIQVFDAGCHARPFEGDPTTYRSGPDPAGEFRAAAASLVAGWREYGLDRELRVLGGERPAEMVFNMTVMEYLTHGWDLAVATGQPVPFSDEESLDVLARAQRTLLAQYRGEGMPFAHAVEIAPGAPATDRLAAFMGRDP